VKNVAGYDLCKLFTGSFGTLGLITEITFKLRPLPAETRTIVASGSRQALLAAGRSIANQFSPVAVELLSPRLAGTVIDGPPNDETALLVRFAGQTRSVIQETARALKTLRDVGLRCATYDEDKSLWKNLSTAPFRPDQDLVWLARLKPTEMNEFLGQVAALEHEEASHVGLSWHVGLGEGRLRAMARAPAYHHETVRALRDLREHAEDRGGSIVIESAPIETKREFDSWGSFGSAGALMKRVKNQLDPGNALSPGRFF
jgi:glycolate oxidase FAD binding subunit